jgi:hypothetical protein
LNLKACKQWLHGYLNACNSDPSNGLRTTTQMTFDTTFLPET